MIILNSLFTLMRPQQWTKNLFVFLPIFFGGKFLDLSALSYVFATFMVFCLISSAVYCINDLVDIESDRKHPVKKNRPVASGRISIQQALLIITILIATALIILWCFVSVRFIPLLAVLAGYLCLNILYSLKLKKYAIIDVFCIGIGFVLRILGGGVAAEIVLSHWIILMVFLLSLFLGFAKRKDDYLLKVNAMEIRGAAKGYTPYFLNMLLVVTGTVTIVCYILYTVSPEVILRYATDYVYCSTVFVMAGLFRYLQLAVVYNDSASPSYILLKDKFILGCVGCWVLFFLFIIYI